ncbi:basic amino acid ABC transporter substrate-binding protein [Campylobacter sp. MIT 21-1685]|uniref:basic amino acid ABC transporter substrate-binding protein n=1 Tax=unclassified Campylobacter TaxID=2593542 RepID=UPI00224AF733|nr:MULTISPECIES: basic amino acid ABC transporter substrate-binding protein [unclassified Campylobacter]MCX2682263.1 basic amino acid ABC transporter substrate-binding protein [Campylobacter sp. MIT 21-1684]MCX2750544.1 basic amino acid ABC transporter substrate-binding protein [Campylobacter sp. MIT 21-1682]MCX2806908.1 basic amino acid ABC transporter substrate-binding protein [Campylobacter sp. MIT 21-1685]
MNTFIKILISSVFTFFLTSCTKTQNDTVKVGTSPNYKPFNYKENAKLTGFDIDLLNEIAKRQGIKIDWIEISFDGLIPALKTGKIDMIASSMSATEERRQSVDFTEVYYTTKNLYIKQKNNTELTTKNDLQGKNIGIMLGTLQEPAAKAIPNSKVQSNEDLNIAILGLKNGKLDAVLADKDVARDFLKANPDLVAFFEEDDGSSGFSFAFDKGKRPELLLQINKTLEQLKTDGTYDTLLKKYDLE